MLRCRADETVAERIDDHLEDDETFDGVVAEEHAVFVAVAGRRDTDARYRLICCVANSMEIALRHSSETWFNIIKFQLL